MRVSLCANLWSSERQKESKRGGVREEVQDGAVKVGARERARGGSEYRGGKGAHRPTDRVSASGEERTNF